MSIKNYFKSRATINRKITELTQELIRTNHLLNDKIEQCVSRLKELDSHKFYFVVLPGSSTEELQYVQDYLNIAKTRVPWTVPKIMVINQKLEEYSAEDIKQIIAGKK